MLHCGCLGSQGGCWGPVLPFSSCRLGHFWLIADDPRHWPFGVWGFYSKAVFVAWWLPVAGQSRPVARKAIERGPPPPREGVGGLFCPLIDANWGIVDQLATHSTGHLGFE
jgi:hypothetical protein